PANTALLTGELDILVNGLSSNTAPMITSGKAKAIAVTTLTRIPAFPSVPTVAESGFPGFEAVSGQTLFVPANAPPDILHKINADVSEILQQQDIIDL